MGALRAKANELPATSMKEVGDDELRALEAKYAAAYREYERCIARIARGGLEPGASLPSETLGELTEAFFGLRAARHAYRDALFNVAFDSRHEGIEVKN